MKLTNPYSGRSKRMIPIARKASGGSASSKHPVAKFTDSYLRGQGTPYSPAYFPSKKSR